MKLHVNDIADLPSVIQETTTKTQRDVNRSVEPVITKKMNPAYRDCVAERG